MSNITDWIKYNLYPSLFNSIDRAFPEHNFKLYSWGWGSNTYLTGEPHKRINKTVITKKSPGTILEQGGEVLSLIDYVIRRDRVEFIEAVKTLSTAIGIEIPKGDYDSSNYQRYKDKLTLLEEANNYFIYCLETSSNAADIREYLKERGYSKTDIKDMELGYIPKQESLIKYLEDKGYSKSLIGETIKLNKAIGSTHSLTIPYRSGGEIKGFKFRTIGDHSPKYLNSSGLDKVGGFFNIAGIKGDKDLVIVEGELDSLHATAKGLENIVATGGSSINKEQIKDATKRGAKKFTICFDYEKGKEKDTVNRINRAIQVILTEGVNRIYIANLPDLGESKTDPDSLIKEQSIDSLKDSIAGALPYYEYKLQNIFNRYGEIEKDRELQPKDIDNLLEEVIETSLAIPDPIDRDRFKTLFTSIEQIKEMGITEESLAITLDRLTSTKAKEKQKEDFDKLLNRAAALHDKGELSKAYEGLEKGIREAKLKDKKEIFTHLKDIITEAQIREYFSKESDSIETGYIISGSELLLPSGALTGIAGATNHGKTDFLINLCLRAVDKYKDKEFYFFTYEMSQENILIRFLNSFLDMDINAGDSNQRALKNYFKTGSTQYFTKSIIEDFEAKKDKFFREYIGTGRLKVKGIDYTSPELNLAFTELNKEGLVGGLFVDYFQLLRLPKEGYKNYSRQEELKVICQDLNDTAKELKLPIILGAQFNREVTTPFRLHATKIGEAGDIERILDTLIGIWNTNKLTVDKDLSKDEKSKFTTMELGSKDKLYTYILKSRETATDIYELLEYNGKRGKITNKDNKDMF